MRAVLLVAIAIVLGCEGPTGPAGPPGPQGPAGSLNRIVLSGTGDSFGNVSVLLPAAAGQNPTIPPGVACYMAPTAASTNWLVVADGYTATSAYCRLNWVAASGVWAVSTLQMSAGWTALWIVTW